MARIDASTGGIKGKYKTLEHTADTGISVRAGTLEELFGLAGCAMFDLMVDLTQVRPVREAKISLEADSLEDLFITWLNELLFRSDVSGMFFSEFDVRSVSDTALEASVKGEPYNESMPITGGDIKAATYHELKVSRSGGGWSAKVIFDV